MPALREKKAIWGPFPTLAKVTAVTTVFPDTGLLKSLLSQKAQIKITTFCTEDARLLLESADFALEVAWVVFRVVMGKFTYDWALCRNAPLRIQVTSQPAPAFGQVLALRASSKLSNMISFNAFHLLSCIVHLDNSNMPHPKCLGS